MITILLLTASTILSQPTHGKEGDDMPLLCSNGLNAPVVCESENRPYIPPAVEVKNGVKLPKIRAEYVLRKLELLDVYPVACQTVINNNRKVAHVRMKLAQQEWERETALVNSEHDARIKELEDRLPAWQVGILTGIGVVIGAALGYGTHRVLQ